MCAVERRLIDIDQTVASSEWSILTAVHSHRLTNRRLGNRRLKGRSNVATFGAGEYESALCGGKSHEMLS